MLGKLVQTDFWPEKDYRPNFQNWVNLLRILRKLRNCDITTKQFPRPGKAENKR